MSARSNSIEGKILDADTNIAIEGVIVIGYWPETISIASFHGGNLIGIIQLIETVTDKGGNFFLPAWMKSTKFTTFINTDPKLIFYKTGYEMLSVKNKFETETFDTSPNLFQPWVSEWNGKTIKLKKIKGGNRDYRKHLINKQFREPFSEIFMFCMYTKLPRTLIAMEDYYKTQPDYIKPGEIPDVVIPTNTQFTHLIKKSAPQNPLPEILTINFLDETYGSDCEVSVVEFLKRSKNNEM